MMRKLSLRVGLVASALLLAGLWAVARDCESPTYIDMGHIVGVSPVHDTPEAAVESFLTNAGELTRDLPEGKLHIEHGSHGAVVTLRTGVIFTRARFDVMPSSVSGWKVVTMARC